MINLFMLYSLLKRLVTPFEKWKAFELGIIDKDGKTLIKRKDFTTGEQKRAYTHMDILIRNMKRILGTFPAGKKVIASYAAAIWLIREGAENSTDLSLMTEDQIVKDLDKIMENIKGLPVSNLLREDEAPAEGGGEDGEDGPTNTSDNIEYMSLPIFAASPRKRKKKKETDDEVFERIMRRVSRDMK